MGQVILSVVYSKKKLGRHDLLTSLSEGTMILVFGFTSPMFSFFFKNSSSSSTTAIFLVDGCGRRLNKLPGSSVSSLFSKFEIEGSGLGCVSEIEPTKVSTFCRFVEKFSRWVRLELFSLKPCFYAIGINSQVR